MIFIEVKDDCLYGGTCNAGACSGKFLWNFRIKFVDHYKTIVVDEFAVDPTDPNKALPNPVKNIIKLSKPGFFYYVVF